MDAGSPEQGDADLIEMCYMSADFKEGVDAFLPQAEAAVERRLDRQCGGRGHARRVPYTRAERAARAALDRGTPGSPLRTCRNELVVGRLNLARPHQRARDLRLAPHRARLSRRTNRSSLAS